MRYQAATNLFAGLSRYSLKPKKSALENLCTELLAWCLQNSRRFQGEFLKLIKLDLLKNFQGPIQIGTQQYWTYKGNDEEDEDNEGQAEPKAGMSGFFDLEIQSARQTNGKRDFLIAIESKIGADFELGQLEKYRAELKKRSN